MKIKPNTKGLSNNKILNYPQTHKYVTNNFNSFLICTNVAQFSSSSKYKIKLLYFTFSDNNHIKHRTTKIIFTHFQNQ